MGNLLPIFGIYPSALGCPLDSSLKGPILISRLIDPTHYKAIEVPAIGRTGMMGISR